MTPIAELMQNHQMFFEAMWVGFGIMSFIFLMLTAVLRDADKDAWHEFMFVSIWFLGASILVLLASV